MATSSVNVYSMDFRNEIAPIGALSLHGFAAPKERRRELPARHRGRSSYRAIPRLVLAANVAASIESHSPVHRLEPGDTPVTYRDVEPLLTPRFTTFERAQLAATRNISLALETRYTSRSFLQNNGDARYVLPAAFNLDG